MIRNQKVLSIVFEREVVPGFSPPRLSLIELKILSCRSGKVRVFFEVTIDVNTIFVIPL